MRNQVLYRVLSPWKFAAWAVLTMLVGVGVVTWLLLAYTGGDTAANQVQLDAIRTAGTIVVGTGGAAALLLAARRQRSTEIALIQKDRDQAHTEADADARRITDLYTKAAEQIGSEKAPVRLAGLYALERLAQDHLEQRQTIVNVLCAYLRMPYTPPGEPPADGADEKLVTSHREQVQEREVRLAAQHILSTHLRPGDNLDSPVKTFWTDIDLNLAGATLIDLDLTNCTSRHCRFNQATFSRSAWFRNATFTDVVRFDGATFTDNAHFEGATFTGNGWFAGAQFTGNARFESAAFKANGWFEGATFAGYAAFSRATFAGTAQFSHATFAGTAGFDRARFTRNASFDGANLSSTRYTSYDTPSPWTNFTEARFERDVPPEVKRFVSPPDEDTTNTAE